MKNAYRICPVVLGTDTFTSVVYGDEQSILVTEEWPCVSSFIPSFETPNCRLYAREPFFLASSLYEELQSRGVAHLMIRCINDQYLITFETPDAVDK